MLCACLMATLVAVQNPPSVTATRAVRRDPVPTPSSSSAPAVAVRRRTTSIAIDGRLDEEEWRRPPNVDSLTQTTPTEGAPGSERSEVWLTFDDDAIYVAARYHDRSADSVMAYLVRRDRQNQSDLFMFYLDPYRDGQNGYQFIVNAAGVQREGTLYADNLQDDTWDAVWESAVRRDENGWTVEVRVPFSQLRMKDGARQEWGFNVGRGIGRRSETSYLVPRLRQGAGFVSRFAQLDGLDGIRPRPRREVMPYVTQKAEAREAMSGDPFFDGSRLSTGLGADFRLGLGANLQLDGALNPDFGQVEVDPAVVNLTDFEVFFQERRPFFVEGTNVFRFGQGGAFGFVTLDWPSVLPFYSRRIGRAPVGRVSGAYVDAPTAVTILGATKLTGRVGPWNVGLLGALTDREEARFAGPTAPSSAEVEPHAAYGTLRAQRTFEAGRFGLGAMTTTSRRFFRGESLRNDINASAQFAGVDGWLGLDTRRDWVLQFQGGGSVVEGSAERIRRLALSPSHYFQRPDADHVSVDSTATRLEGAYGRAQLVKQRGAFIFHTGVGAISPGFDINDAGFVGRTDHVTSHLVTGWRWTRPGSWFQSATTTNSVYSSWDFGGNRTILAFAPSGNVQFNNFTSVFASATLNAQAFDNRATRGGPLMASPRSARGHLGWYSDFRRPLSYGFSGTYGNTEGALGASWSGDLEGEWRPSTSLNLRFAASVGRTRNPVQPVRSVADPLATETFGRRYVFGHLDQRLLMASLRADWIFSPRASFELYVQPVVSSVRYDAFRELRRPGTLDLLTYGTEGSTWERSTGTIDPDGTGPAASFSVGQTDGTFASLRGNAVFRWEYTRGSTLYLVWTQMRSGQEAATTFAPVSSLGDLFDRAGDNAVLLKVSYWLSK